ncbi:chitin synthase-domain-containing protein [Mycotypha africana]|uniref:chitin synthase-domain-containing protein n=1 Tax=Mycotypha africana TaxID=64632 RepID=UPI00230115B5|nr:chitin synthase-domain-containing protein [Mycotypha africana]KAI8975357.1 chitin synthase-domain-containing protein [Mycotypha africana]
MSNSRNSTFLFDLSNQEQRKMDEDSITQCLRTAFQNNVIYSRAGDSVLVAMNPYKQMPFLSQQYVAEYKDTTATVDGQQQEPLPSHIYKLTNQAYLHMRRTGIDQSLILCGESGSGKTEFFKTILSHLIQLSSHKKESKLQTQINNVQILLEAFGNARTVLNDNASKFGKYMELQFNERGRMVGAMLLNYLLDKSRVTECPQHEQTFHIFYQLLAGASAEEKHILQLNDDIQYRYVPRKMAAAGREAEQFKAIKQAMKILGIHKKYQARIWQFLACLLHLGQLEFVDDHTIQESAFVKNQAELNLCADFLGVDPHALEDIFTYKTQLIKKDVTTLILDASGASKQRDEIVKSLYSLLFTWLVEHINKRLSFNTIHNFIGILDLPGPRLQFSNNSGGKGFSASSIADFNAFCINLSNERLQHFLQKAIFEVDVAEYQSDGLATEEVPYFNNQACVELLTRRREGLTDIINHYAKSPSSSSPVSDSDIIDTFAKYNNEHASFAIKQADTGAKLFAIQHFAGQVTYSPSRFLESNKDILNPDLVQLIRGSDTAPASYNHFVVELFSNDSIQTETHPKQTAAILNAQQKSGPLRGPSMRRTKSTKRRGSILQPPVIMEEDNNNNNEKPSSRKKNQVSTVLSQINKSFDELFKTLDETIPWFVLCIKPNDSAAPNQFDSHRVRNQIRAWGVPQLCKRLQVQYTNILFFEEFLERYANIISAKKQDQQPLGQQELIDAIEDANAREKCQRVITLFGWTDKQVALGNSKIFLCETVWELLEDILRTEEKAQQRKLKDEKRINDNMAAIATGTIAAAAPIMNLEGEDQNSETLSNMSYSSHTEFLNPAVNTPLGQNTGRYDAAAIAAASAGLPLPRNPNSASGSVYTDDQRSFLSDDEFHNQQHRQGATTNSSYHDTESQFGGSETYGIHNSYTNPELKHMLSTPVVEEVGPTEDEDEKPTRARRHWLNFVWFMTWWIPTPFLVMCGKMKRPDIQIAWREKMTLCLCIFLTSGFIIWFLVFFGALVCPHQDVFSTSELQSHSDKDNAYVAIRGEVFDLTKFAPHHWASQVIPQSAILEYGGKDVSPLFPVQVSALCQGVTGNVSPYVSLDFNANLTDSNARYHNFLPNSGDPRPDWYFEKMTYLRKNYKLGAMGFTPKDIATQATNPVDMSGIKTTRQWAILNGNVYDLTYYSLGGRRFDLPENVASPDPSELNFLDNAVVTLFQQKAGQDITEAWNALPLDPALKSRQEVCLRNLYYVGAVDQRNSARCLFAEYLLLIVTVFLCLVIVFKFLAALQFRSRREPEKHEKFVICQVPCYTEGEEELRKTIDSISALQYDDTRKLLFIICDGMIIGGGNDRPTPRIVLDILGVDPSIDPEALSFFSVGEGQKQHNMAKIYSGLYETHGHVVPYIVVSKVGKPTERQKPGNRGKRDSQLILMNFLNKVHFNSPMTPFELELYHQIKNVIGVNPSFYEFILMVDADTEVMPDGLNKMVSVFTHDSKIIGLCGETVLSNEKSTWVTMIQVYEYFISHYLIKAFESLFGSVTCLPGCFSMYRIRSPQMNKPLLVSNQIIEDYSINKVDTLHKKNLLHLGEDRYLTTLILKHFPSYKTKFVSDAKCATNAPDQWSVLLSQRRRWINSTIHNLGELVFLPQLCGFCCFSMRFVVMLDLLSTLVQPAIVGYLVYLIYMLATSTSGVPIMSIVTIAGVYGLQAIIFLVHRKWEYIMWMIVSIFAIPVFSFMIPIYAYWHFDDFSWGNTRVVMGEKGKKVVMADEGKFDRKSIPVMTWDEYEKSMYDDDFNGGSGMFNDNMSVGSYGSQKSGYSHGTYYSQHSYTSRPMGQYTNMTAAGSNQSFMMYPPQTTRASSPAYNNNLTPFQTPVPGYTAPNVTGGRNTAMSGHFHNQTPFQ